LLATADEVVNKPFSVEAQNASLWPIADIRDCQLQASYAHHKGHAAAKSGQRDKSV
jgi:hypothetical protein